MSVIAVHNPVTGATVGRVSITSREEIRQHALDARSAQQEWERPFDEHRKLLIRFHDLLLDNDEAVLDTIQAETGKSRHDAFTEVLGVAAT